MNTGRYSIFKRVSPHLRSKVELYEGDMPLFERKAIEKEIEKIFERKVYMKSGGYVVIERPRACGHRCEQRQIYREEKT